ncbi:hypothetical protein [Pseudoalteromonas sp. JB197]|uniref:hypothetical protein n=1 Tax=Pseudoalteromonas sp. JB197 TaxID=1434839 RepID=UPI00097EE30A|nr:hypothetical protein [Pseudoalteromonas sp. JB197]PCC12903.1 hypothetical protein CIK86_06210 [Pseudoalteromonas sp. JB197]SJN25480.1 hypothetical protein CZ797_04260 [Pseudoalteromonas sp. JB197]
MSWWDSIVDIGGDLYDGAAAVVTDQYNAYTEYQKAAQSDAAKNVDNLKQAEPMKGNTVDGSTTVAVTGSQQQNGAPMFSNQIIAGVDNRLLIAGGLIAVLLVMKK